MFSLAKLPDFENGTSWEYHEESGVCSVGEQLILMKNILELEEAGFLIIGK